MKKKILVRGPALSQTGYGEQCRFALRALRSREDLFDIYLMNIPWGGSNWIFEDNDERKWIDSLISKAQPLLAQQQANPKVALFDISLQVTIPNELQKMAPQNILYTAGIETDKACAAWVGKCHEFADKILVISEHAKAGLQVPVRAKDQTGNEILFTLEKPIEVVHYPVKKAEAVNLPLDLETDFNFLAMSQFGPRKNFKNTITWFVEEFHDDPNVGLVVKLFGKGNSKIDREWSENQLKAFLENTPDRKCKIYLLHGYLNEKELHSLYVHPKIKALINFGHGEGFGLPLFEAAYSGLPVITHDFGGQKDFLYAPKKDKKTKKKKMRAHFSKILYDLKPVQQEAVWQGVIEPDMNWAWPNPTSCKLAMREAVKNYGMLQGEAKRLKKWLEEEFEESKKYNNFVESVWGGKVFNPNSVKVEELPKISIITSVYNGDEYIDGFLEDITNQTIFKEKCELIMINADSPGDEEETILRYQKMYPDNIIYEKLDSDPGIYGVWNMAVEMSTGDFITNANLDDRKAVDSLEAHAKTLVANKNIDLVYADSYITNKPNETYQNNSSQDRRYNFEEFSKEGMLRGNLPHNNPMWRKSLHKKHGLFDDSYRSAGDWEYWLRCAISGSSFKKLAGVHGLYYFNPKGISTNFENFAWKQEEESRVYNKYKSALSG